jgi:Inner membrane component of T3SS, cytoplasmic domain
MAALAIIHITHASGQASRYFEVHHWPITIGRALDNDLILTDEYVAPHHARLAQEGDRISLHVLESSNGVRLEDGAIIPANTTAAIEVQQSAALGLSTIRVLDDAVSRLPEKPLSELSAETSATKSDAKPRAAALVPSRSWGSTLGWLGGLVLVLIAEGFVSNNPENFVLNSAKLIGTYIGGFVLWALVWGLLSKVFSGTVNFGAHFFAVVKAAILTQLVLWHLHAAGFAFSMPFLSQFDSVIVIIAFGWLIANHLKIALGDDVGTSFTHKSGRRVQYGVISLVIAAIALSVGVRYSNTGRITDGLYLSTFLPTSWRLHAAKSPEALDQGMAALKIRTDSQLNKDANEPDTDSED